LIGGRRLASTGSGWGQITGCFITVINIFVRQSAGNIWNSYENISFSKGTLLIGASY